MAALLLLLLNLVFANAGLDPNGVPADARLGWDPNGTSADARAGWDPDG